MDSNVVIRVENISKKYCKSLKRSIVYGLSDIGRNMVGLSSHSDKLRSNEFWAAKDISFEVKKGETLGLIGANGSGKTTLLKMLNGIFWPDKGRISIKGRVGALIAVGAGFHPLLNGRENIYINGAILGMTKSELDKKFDAIVEFSGVGDFLDTPVKNYSSGMFVRLGFAVAVFCHPDILLVDEVLAVGDMNFQRKCLERIKELNNAGCSIILVSHNLLQIESVCQKSIFMHKGVIHKMGDTKGVIAEYVNHENSILDVEHHESNAGRGESHKTGEILIKEVQLLNNKGESVNDLYPKQCLKIRISFYAKRRVKKPNFMAIIHLHSMRILVSSSKVLNHSPEFVEGHGIIECLIDEVPLLPNKYSVDLFIKDEEHDTFFDYRKNAAFFVIKVPLAGDTAYRVSGDMGIVYEETQWQII